MSPYNSREASPADPCPRTEWRGMMPSTPRSPPANAAAAVSLEGKRALVVEDSWHIAFAVKCLLENAGMTVIGPAARLEAAEALLAESLPDVAVMDVNLHGKLALGLVDALNARGVPVIVVSGYEMVDEIKGKVDAFLTKPVRSRALIAAVKDALGSASPAC